MINERKEPVTMPDTTMHRCPIRGCGCWVPEPEYVEHLSRVHQEPWRRPREVADRVFGKIRRRGPVAKFVSGGRC